MIDTAHIIHVVKLLLVFKDSLVGIYPMEFSLHVLPFIDL